MDAPSGTNFHNINQCSCPLTFYFSFYYCIFQDVPLSCEPDEINCYKDVPMHILTGEQAFLKMRLLQTSTSCNSLLGMRGWWVMETFTYEPVTVQNLRTHSATIFGRLKNRKTKERFGCQLWSLVCSLPSYSALLSSAAPRHMKSGATPPRQFFRRYSADPHP